MMLHSCGILSHAEAHCDMVSYVLYPICCCGVLLAEIVVTLILGCIATRNEGLIVLVAVLFGLVVQCLPS
uniref:Uncharacterized protein n=1 Tax=Arundo donax TaxID=35708 RepID=A0A0A9BHH3_ARUDO